MFEMLLSAWMINEPAVAGWSFNPTHEMVASADTAWVTSNPPYMAIVLASAQQDIQKNNSLYGAIGECGITQKNETQNLTPQDQAYSYFYLKDTEAPGWDDGEQMARVLKNSIEKGTPNYYAIDPHIDVKEIKVLQQPKYGELSQTESGWSYTPRKDYVGNDKITFLVDMTGYKIKVAYFIKIVTEKAPDRYDRTKDATYRSKYDIYSEKYCPSGEQWLITESAPLTLISTITFRDLTGAAVGETVFVGWGFNPTREALAYADAAWVTSNPPYLI